MTLDPQIVGLIAFGFMLLLIVIGVPIAFAMLGTAAIGLFIVGGPIHAETQISMTFIEQGANFVIVAIPDGTSVQVFPKPISLVDAGTSVLEKAYANINVQIGSGATMDRVNVDSSVKVNAFWCKNSIEVTGGDAPIQLLNEFGGMKVISSTMKNGQKMYMAYDGNLETLSFKCRLFTWYGLTNCNPSANGIGISF